jgi:hypothetical protein
LDPFRWGVVMGCRGRKRVYSVDDGFFDDLRSEKKCYWLGALTADGHSRESINKVIFEISNKDREWIEQLKDHLKFMGPVKPTKHNCVRIVMSSKRLTERLSSLGLDGHKTFTVAFCASVPEQLVRHYIRGIIDGDGSITFSRGAPVLSVSGTKGVLEGIRSYFEGCILEAGALPKKKRIHELKNSNICKIKYEGTRLVPFLLSHIYSKAGVSMLRKKNLALGIIEDYGIKVPKNSRP